MTSPSPKPAAKSRRPTPKSPPGRSWVWLGAVLVLTFVAYIPSLDNDFTNWDDPSYVTNNPSLAHPTLREIVATPVGGNYHPLTMLSLALNYRMSQLHPASYHWLSLLLHLGNTALTFLFIQGLAGGLWAPVFTSLLFGIHPMHVESVAWISERKDVLYAFFYLAGLMTYLRYIATKRWVWFAWTLAAFILSMASKPAAVTFPIVLLAIDWYRRRGFGVGVLLEKAPYFALALVAGLLTLHGQKEAGAVVEPHVWSPGQRVLFAASGLVMYFVKLVAPFGLSALYPLPRRGIAHLGTEFYLSLAAVVVLLPLLVFAFRRNRAVLFGFAFFFVNIVLVLQFVTIGRALMADRYTYLPYIGLLFALSYWMDSEPNPFAPSSALKTVAAGVLVLLVPVSLVQTWKRCDVWQDSGTLWTSTIEKYPHQLFDAYFLRGTYYHHTVGRPEAAMADYDEALKLNPNSPNALANKGTLLFDLGRTDSAYVFLDRALALKPNMAGALNNRGAIRGQRGDLRGAIADFTGAIAADHQYRDPHENRAVAYYMTGQYQQAIADSRRAIELDPENPDNHALLDAIGQYEQALHRYQEAVAAHGEAIRRAPYGDRRMPGYYYNRSLAYWGLGDRASALRDAQEAQRLGASLPEEYLRKLGAPPTTHGAP